MLNESEKRAAQLAVSRYGANPGRIRRLIQSVHEARSRGESVDFIARLQEDQLLSSGEIQELRTGLAKTEFFPLDKNGAEKPDVFTAATVLPSEPPEDGEDAEDAEPAHPLPELRSLGGYRIMRRLGEGGTGAVFLAYHEKENRQVALKVLAQGLAKNQPSLDRFYREAKSGALLNHPNIVRNLAAGQDKSTGVHYLVLEYVDGPSGLDLLDRYGRLAVPDAIHIILDIARALEHAHSRNVVHRDIKPGNILLTQSGMAKLADMGLAKRTDEASHLTHARQGFGTPYYMPYEQAMNAKYADSRSDIYALGATLYHLVAGEVPFGGVNSLEIVDKKAVGTYTAASQLNTDVPFALDRILARMMAKEPRDRYQTVSELIVDLERSNLAASVPSFIDPQLAMQDPVVRQRLTSPAQTTCPDLRPGEAKAAPDAFWFLRVKDKHGQIAKKKLTFEEVAQRLRAGKIAAHMEASRTAKGEYRALSSYAEFQEVLVGLGSGKQNDRPSDPEDAPTARESRLALWLTLGAGAAVVVLVLLVLLARGG